MKKFPHIGMRTLKTALSVVIGLYISALLNLHSPIFVTIASITTMQPSYYETYEAVRLRLFTCIIGVSLGYILSLITINPLIRPLIAGFGIIVIIMILLKFKLSRMISLTIIVFMASFVAKSDKLVYGINRLLGTVIGVGVSVFINFLIKSPNISEEFDSTLEKTYIVLMRITKSILLMQRHPSMSTLQDDIQEANHYFELITYEVDQPFVHEMEVGHRDEITKDLNEIYVSLRTINYMEKAYPNLTKTNRNLIEDVFNFTIIFDGNMDGSKNIVYNYHIYDLLVRLKRLTEIYEGESFYGKQQA